MLRLQLWRRFTALLSLLKTLRFLSELIKSIGKRVSFLSQYSKKRIFISIHLSEGRRKRLNGAVWREKSRAKLNPFLERLLVVERRAKTGERNATDRGGNVMLLMKAAGKSGRGDAETCLDTTLWMTSARMNSRQGAARVRTSPIESLVEEPGADSLSPKKVIFQEDS